MRIRYQRGNAAVTIDKKNNYAVLTVIDSQENIYQEVIDIDNANAIVQAWTFDLSYEPSIEEETVTLTIHQCNQCGHRWWGTVGSYCEQCN